jgi:hypothetical protein
MYQPFAALAVDAMAMAVAASNVVRSFIGRYPSFAW